MRIAIFTNNYLPNPYGVSTSIEAFRRDFEKLGHQVFIFAPNFPGYIDKNPNVFRYPALDINFKFRFPLAIPYSRNIDKILESLDLDIIHSQHPNLLGTAAMKWARRKKIPLVFTWHTLYDQYAHFAKVIPKKMAAWYMIRKAVNFANKSDIVVAPTDSIIPILRNWGVKKEIVPVMTGIKEGDFSGANRKETREKYKIKEDEILLFVVTRLTCEKNVDFLMRSAVEILKKNKKTKFLVGGEGYLRNSLEKIAAENNVSSQVIFAGFIPENSKKDYLAAADIFVYGSKSETQGMVVAEAMYVGLPVVAVDATGSRSLVINNANGFLVREDEKEFSKAVLKIIDDKNLREKFGEASKKIARENFTSEICAGKMLATYGYLTFSFRKKK